MYTCICICTYTCIVCTCTHNYNYNYTAAGYQVMDDRVSIYILCYIITCIVLCTFNYILDFIKGNQRCPTIIKRITSFLQRLME